MKTRSLLATVIAGLLIIATGCVGPFYTSESGFMKGKGKGIFSARAAADAQSERLALQILEEVRSGKWTDPDGNITPKGFRGKIANFYSYEMVNIIIAGPGLPKSYLLAAGQQIEEYLVPGEYTARMYIDGREIGRPWIFHVGMQTSSFLGVNYPWYIYAGRMRW